MINPTNKNLIFIDNYDSFSYNLIQAFSVLGIPTHIIHNDQISIEELKVLHPSHLVLGPGPRTPYEAGISLPALEYFADKIPILGVCLGHQAIGVHFGATLCRAFSVQHGKRDFLYHTQKQLFQHLPNPLQIGRYHSLSIRDIPADLQIDATADDGTIMAISHRKHPIFGVQFHPESILTPFGYQLLHTFLQL